MKKLITGITLLTSIAFFGQTNKIESTGNVGIGITTPESKLHVYNNDGNVTGATGLTIEQEGVGDSQLQYLLTGVQRWVTGINNSDEDKFMIGRGQDWATGTDLVITKTGNVGIGTTSPRAKLHVESSGDLVAKGSDPAFLVGSREGGHIAIDGNEIGAFYGNQYSDLYINASGSTSNTIINGSSGNVGVGTANPDAPLTVKGKIHCEEVQVDLSVPADYVFEKYYTGISELKEAYTMPTLEEVATYTKENHHLPSIPSAKEIQEEGLHLKEMTNLLLQKIEELTLYTIEQQKHINTQEKRINALEGKLTTQK